MKILSFLVILFLMNYTCGLLLCPKSNNPNQTINIDTSYTINPVIYNDEIYTAVQVGKKIFLNRFKGKIQYGTSEF